MPAESDVAKGRAQRPDDKYWEDLYAELTPAKSVGQMAENAKFIVSTVAIVGAVLAGFGLVGADRLASTLLGTILALAAIACAVLALALALSFLRLRVDDLNGENRRDVEKWYRAQVRRAGLLRAGGILLVVAVASAGAAATFSIRTLKDSGPVVVLARTVGGAGGPVTSGSIACKGCAADRTYELRVVVASSSVPCLQAVVGTDDTGAFQVAVPSCAAPYDATVTAMVDGKTVAVLARAD